MNELPIEPQERCVDVKERQIPFVQLQFYRPTFWKPNVSGSPELNLEQFIFPHTAVRFARNELVVSGWQWVACSANVV